MKKPANCKVCFAILNISKVCLPAGCNATSKYSYKPSTKVSDEYLLWISDVDGIPRLGRHAMFWYANYCLLLSSILLKKDKNVQQALMLLKDKLLSSVDKSLICSSFWSFYYKKIFFHNPFLNMYAFIISSENQYSESKLYVIWHTCIHTGW